MTIEQYIKAVNDFLPPGSILTFIGIFILTIAISLLIGLAWGLLAFGICMIIWGIAVNCNSPRRY